ncbi:MAG: uncharacterized protein JWM51_1410, partial [Microbacteriaceae bacterium]|nr:uncharacterized protein [Microbacteriaceae bacterium]
GSSADDKERSRSMRVARFDDVAGDAQGFVIYRVAENPGVVFGHSVEVDYLASATDDAYATLWRYVLELDLVGEVTAKLRSIDEAFAWQVSDFRAVTKLAQRDHLWTRILDVKAALEARRYSAYGSIVLEVADPLGFAEGRYLLTVADDGTAEVELLLGDTPEDAAAIALDVGALSAIYLGGVSAVTLTRAGRITELREGSSSAVDASFRTAVTPWLSIWF